jgi:hypothetical protein
MQTIEYETVAVAVAAYDCRLVRTIDTISSCFSIPPAAPDRAETAV